MTSTDDTILGLTASVSLDDYPASMFLIDTGSTLTWLFSSEYATPKEGVLEQVSYAQEILRGYRLKMRINVGGLDVLPEAEVMVSSRDSGDVREHNRGFDGILGLSKASQFPSFTLDLKSDPPMLSFNQPPPDMTKFPLIEKSPYWAFSAVKLIVGNLTIRKTYTVIFDSGSSLTILPADILLEEPRYIVLVGTSSQELRLETHGAVTFRDRLPEDTIVIGLHALADRVVSVSRDGWIGFNCPQVAFENISVLMSETPRELTESFIMRAGLGVARVARRKAENDAQLLANRIALLKQEEEKANKKISDTRKRAQQIVLARQRCEQRDRQRIALEHARREDLQRTAENARRLKLQIHERNAEAIDNIRQIKRRQAVETKASIREYNLTQQGGMFAVQQKKHNAAELVRRDREEARRRIDREKMAKLEMFKLDYATRVEREDLLRAQTEQLVTAMEEQERALIFRLKNKQIEQQSAFEALEKVA